MSSIDYAIIVAYFAIVMGVGFWCQRAASKNLDSYFLGGKSMHWLALSMSGSVATFDITGTMWIVALIYLFGMKSMWNHWMWGFLMAAFFMSYMGKWVRRSNVMTGAEWMVTRFGDGRDGRTARMAYTAMAVVMLVGFVGYAFQGIGKFSAVYIDIQPLTSWIASSVPSLTSAMDSCAANQPTVLALGVFAVTTLYVLLGGLYGVVFTNVIQTVVLTVASVLIAVVAYTQLTPEMLAAVEPVDGTSMTSLAPVWRIDAALPVDYAIYGCFGALTLVWVVKGLLLNLGGPGQMTDFQIFLATRSPREAAKLGAAWSGFLVVRWAMCMGIAMLALGHSLDVTDADGQFDAESVMPVVLNEFLGPGTLGLVIAGLLAAFMSTFSATVNAAASYLIRDLWQPLIAPRADAKHLVRAGYVATLGVVAAGTLLGFQAKSIAEIWNWIMMSVAAAVVVPNVLRWYWWRLNGTGYAAGTLAGIVVSLGLLILVKTAAFRAGAIAAGDPTPALLEFARTLNLPYVSFPLVSIVSIVGCLAGTWLTRPTDEAVLVSFYRTVRPFGFWGPIRRQSELSPQQLSDPAESVAAAILNVLLAAAMILGAYLGPMYLVGHWNQQAAIWLGVAAAAAVVLYFTWYRNLPAE